ncbi:MAG: hypothetical protein H5U17_16705 [Defluviimonas sp.]|nr:hypothetical protein [Defluviimonas sp.]
MTSQLSYSLRERTICGWLNTAGASGGRPPAQLSPEQVGGVDLIRRRGAELEQPRAAAVIQAGSARSGIELRGGYAARRSAGLARARDRCDPLGTSASSSESDIHRPLFSAFRADQAAPPPGHAGGRERPNR